jgi:two-component system chemotaxis response regulator CheY
MRRILVNTVIKAGYSDVKEAEDGKDGLAKLLAGEYDLLMTDWNMPNMNGLELVQTVRADDKLKNIPILMVTTRNMKEDIVNQFMKLRINGLECRAGIVRRTEILRFPDHSLNNLSSRLVFPLQFGYEQTDCINIVFCLIGCPHRREEFLFLLGEMFFQLHLQLAEVSMQFHELIFAMMIVHK